MRIFVSHCAKHDARSAVVVQRLVDDLSDGEVRLVWDRDLLGVGDDWNDKLLTEMDSCDGAILLLSAAALKRPYVVMECTILTQRKRHSGKWGGNMFELHSRLMELSGQYAFHNPCARSGLNKNPVFTGHG